MSVAAWRNMLQRCAASSSSDRGTPWRCRYCGAAQTMSCTGNSRRPITLSSGEAPMRNPASTRSSTQLPMPSSSRTSGTMPGCRRQNSSSSGISTGAKQDLGPTMRNGPAMPSRLSRARFSARSSAASAGWVSCRKRWPSSVSARLRVVRCSRRTPRCCSRWATAWLAAWGLTPWDSAAWRRLPSSTALAKVAMARSSLMGMVRKSGIRGLTVPQYPAFAHALPAACGAS